MKFVIMGVITLTTLIAITTISFCVFQIVKSKRTINGLGYKWDDMSHTHLLFHYFCDYFLGNSLGIFLEYSWNILEKVFNLKNK